MVIGVALLCLAVNRLCYNLTVTMKNWVKSIAGKGVRAPCWKIEALLYVHKKITTNLHCRGNMTKISKFQKLLAKMMNDKERL